VPSIKRAASLRRRRLQGPQGGGSGRKGQGWDRELLARGPTLRPNLSRLKEGTSDVETGIGPPTGNRDITGDNPQPPAIPGNRIRWGGRGP